MCVHLKTFNESFRTWAEARENEQDFPFMYGGVLAEEEPATNPLVPVMAPLLSHPSPEPDTTTL